MIRRPMFYCLFLLVVFGALVLRTPQSGQRPMHNDEGVNTVKFRELMETGRFQYDPSEYHGPTLYYFTLPAVWASGATKFADTQETTYRAVPAFFGVALILLSLALVRDLGWGAVLWAGAFVAASPVMVFYSRYYIHEMLLVFFTFAAIIGGWRFWVSGRWRWAIFTGVAVGLMWATKETWVLSLAAACGAIGLTWLAEKLRPTDHPPMRVRAWPIAAAVAVALVVAAVLFSGFFTNPGGVKDAVAAYTNYFDRGSGGNIHDHSFGWYFKLLWWFQAPVPPTYKVNRNPIFTEAAPLALAMIGMVTALLLRRGMGSRPAAPVEQRRPLAPTEEIATLGSATPIAAAAATAVQTAPAIPLLRFLGFYAALLWLIYSLIPYKTPWCLLTPYHATLLVAGFAVAQVLAGIAHLASKAAGNSPRWSPVSATIAVLVVSAVFLWPIWQPLSRPKKQPWPINAEQALLEPGWDLWSQSQMCNSPRWFADPKNPWVYGHTSVDIADGVRLMNTIGQVVGRDVYVQVVTIDCWPLPWYLRGFDRVGYWPRPPAKLNGDVIIGPDDVLKEIQRIEQQGGPKYHESSFGLRPGVVLWIMVRQGMWDKLVERWEAEGAVKLPKT